MPTDFDIEGTPSEVDSQHCIQAPQPQACVLVKPEPSDPHLVTRQILRPKVSDQDNFFFLTEGTKASIKLRSRAWTEIGQNRELSQQTRQPIRTRVAPLCVPAQQVNYNAPSNSSSTNKCLLDQSGYLGLLMALVFIQGHILLRIKLLHVPGYLFVPACSKSSSLKVDQLLSICA